MLKVMDGARTLDGANLTPDLVQTTLTVGATAIANTTGIQMGGIANELLVSVLVTSVAAGCTLVVKVQESNDDSTYTDVSGATKTFAATAANDAAWISVDWRNPNRKLYARLNATVTGANAAVLSANTLRVTPADGVVTADAAMVEA